ncbi:MAG TPA: hypothetical protein VJT49_16715 [Amycolatopsis sp.]|uniref:hypothetical protein n=1 Tax=Amycolatopsis sp. TaxID=37632 RepID=UPI002B45D27F|nr:hypothetical protein [Amycolatopsis sp.]HKS46717.1 hypothetical protein [Amycolatopsis sp.]
MGHCLHPVETKPDDTCPNHCGQADCIHWQWGAAAARWRPELVTDPDYVRGSLP